MKPFSVFLVSMIATTAWPVSGQQTPANPNPQKSQSKLNSKTKDPNEIVCESENLTGSRIGAKRVCATRSQWEERRLNDRQSIEKDQTQIGMPG